MSDADVDAKSREKAYALFGSPLLDEADVGTVESLRRIHAHLFGGLYDSAGRVRTLNIAEGGFQFAPARFLPSTLESVERMPDGALDEIIEKYVEMNVAHPFMDGNGRSARIWLDMMLKRRLNSCVDWSMISKRDYMSAMRESVVDPSRIKTLIASALTDRTSDRETFLRGIDRPWLFERDDDGDGDPGMERAQLTSPG